MPGQFCISIDLELAWGVWDHLTDDYISRCSELERSIVQRLLVTLDSYEISATWAIVGNLLLDAPQMSRGRKEVWYAPDLIEAIKSARTPQEIGSHSFGHVYFPSISPDEAQSDIDAARRIHAERQLAFDSFVFPRNMVGHEAILASAGIKVFRSVDRGWYTSVARANRFAGRLAHLVDNMLPIPPSTVVPIRHPNGLVELPSSMLLMARNGARKLVSSSALTSKARFGLQAAARKSEVFHLWFHPSNFYHSTESQFQALDRILAIAAAMRDRGHIEAMTMGAFAA
jgi:hypothetical protein